MNPKHKKKIRRKIKDAQSRAFAKWFCDKILRRISETQSKMIVDKLR